MVTAPAARRATATRHSSLEGPGCAFDDMNLGTPPSVSWVIGRLTYSRGGSGNAKRCFVTSSRVALGERSIVTVTQSVAPTPSNSGVQSFRFRSLRVKSAPVFTSESQISGQAELAQRPVCAAGVDPTLWDV